MGKVSKTIALALILILVLVLVSIFSSIKTIQADIIAEDSWKELAPMHQARRGLGVIEADGRIYALGGSLSDYPFRSIVGTNEQYDPTTNTWLYKASMPTPRVYFATAEYQNKIYCIGGVSGEKLVDDKSGFYTPIVSNVVEVYDALTDTWTNKQPMPKGGGMHMSAQEVNGQIYVIQSLYVYVYNPVNDSWTERNGLFIPRYSAVIDDKIVATGIHDIGFPVNSTYYGGLNLVQQVVTYDPTSNNLTYGADASVGIDSGSVGATSGIYAPQRVYVMGVNSPYSPSVSVNQAYDPITDTWGTAKPMPTLRIDFGLAVINDTLYAIGGLRISYSYSSTDGYIQSSNASPTNANEQYTPIGYGTIQPQITILSPQFKVYNSSTITLDFSVDKPYVGLSYSLDGKDNITVDGNTTIANLVNGNHTLTIYAEDSFGNIGNQTINFAVDIPQTGIFESTLAVVVVAVSAIVFLIVGLLLFRRHRKTANISK